MRAFVVTSPGVGTVEDVAEPVAGVGQVIVDVALAGICGTDVALFHENAEELQRRRTSHPLRLGHEWCGSISEIGDGVDPGLLGRRVTGDTMIGCGVCGRCRVGNHHVCEDRYEIGVRGGWPGALAERLLVPLAAIHPLPDAVDEVRGALVEPGGNAYRSVVASGAAPGRRILVIGPGTIGLLCAQFARAAGAEVHVLGRSTESLALAERMGVDGAWTESDLPTLHWDAVIDASDAKGMPHRAAELVAPTGRVVFVGISTQPSLVDSRVFARKDATAVGILGGSAGIDATISSYASGTVDPTPLVATTVGLRQVGRVLDGWKPDRATAAPKILVDPHS